MCLVIRLIRESLKSEKRMLALTKEYNQTELELLQEKNVYKKVILLSSAVIFFGSSI